MTILGNIDADGYIKDPPRSNEIRGRPRGRSGAVCELVLEKIPDLRTRSAVAARLASPSAC